MRSSALWRKQVMFSLNRPLEEVNPIVYFVIFSVHRTTWSLKRNRTYRQASFFFFSARSIRFLFHHDKANHWLTGWRTIFVYVVFLFLLYMKRRNVRKESTRETRSRLESAESRSWSNMDNNERIKGFDQSQDCFDLNINVIFFFFIVCVITSWKRNRLCVEDLFGITCADRIFSGTSTQGENGYFESCVSKRTPILLIYAFLSSCILISVRTTNRKTSERKIEIMTDNTLCHIDSPFRGQMVRGWLLPRTSWSMTTSIYVELMANLPDILPYVSCQADQGLKMQWNISTKVSYVIKRIHTQERKKKENFEIPLGISITTYEDYSVRVFFHWNTRCRCRK